MAIAGSPGIPSCGVLIQRQQLETVGMVCNKPRSVVFEDMSAAADHLRRLPATIIQIDMRYPNYSRLEQYLRLTGHVK